MDSAHDKGQCTRGQIIVFVALIDVIWGNCSWVRDVGMWRTQVYANIGLQRRQVAMLCTIVVFPSRFRCD